MASPIAHDAHSGPIHRSTRHSSTMDAEDMSGVSSTAAPERRLDGPPRQAQACADDNDAHALPHPWQRSARYR